MSSHSRLQKFYYRILIKGLPMFWMFLAVGIVGGGILLFCTEVDGMSLIARIWQG